MTDLICLNLKFLLNIACPIQPGTLNLFRQLTHFLKLKRYKIISKQEILEASKYAEVKYQYHNMNIESSQNVYRYDDHFVGKAVNCKGLVLS